MAARRRRHRAEPVENCGGDPECESVSRGPERVWQLRRLPLEFCRRQTETKSLATNGSAAGAHNRIRRDEPRFGQTRIQIRRLDHLLRVDASDRHGQRPFRLVPATSRAPRRRITINNGATGMSDMAGCGREGMRSSAVGTAKIQLKTKVSLAQM